MRSVARGARAFNCDCERDAGAVGRSERRVGWKPSLQNADWQQRFGFAQLVWKRAPAAGLDKSWGRRCLARRRRGPCGESLRKRIWICGDASRMETVRVTSGCSRRSGRPAAVNPSSDLARIARRNEWAVLRWGKDKKFRQRALRTQGSQSEKMPARVWQQST